MPTLGRKRALSVFGVLAAGALVAGQRASHWLDTQGLTAIDFANELTRSEPRFEWKSIERKHWQAVVATKGDESLAQTDAHEGTGRGCAPGMVRVKGAFRDEARGTATGFIERLQDGACTEWISKEFPARCRTFDREKIAKDIASVPTTELDFCIDRFEYPNAIGQNPMIVATWREAEQLCKANDKRLCTENEWTFACEGEEARPYPYGWTRDDTACVMDRPWRAFTEGALQPRDGDRARNELDTLWQGEPSGSRPLCRSVFGVYDQTGNVDEWTRSVNPTGYRSILKGGYWGPVRARCRPATRAHGEDFIAYQQSFRCCDASGQEKEPDVEVAEPLDAGMIEPATDETPDVPYIDGGTDDDRVAIGKVRARGCNAAGASPSSALGLAMILAFRARARWSRRTARAPRIP